MRAARTVRLLSLVGVLCVARGAGAQRGPEGAAVQAFAALESGDAEALPGLLAALDAAGLPRGATVLLAGLAQSPHAQVRAAVRAELLARAASDVALAQPLLARDPGLEGSAPPELAVVLARSHLERALALAPAEEGAAFSSAGTAEPALESASVQVRQASPAAEAELRAARALAAAIPEASAAAGEARELAGLTALAAGDARAAEKAFLALAQPRADRASEADAARRQRAILQLARLAYARGDDASALALYGKVSRAAPEWLDAVFESSWARFRKGEDEKALGNLMTLHAPFFQGRDFPESFVLKALLLYENCRFADARRTLAGFERSFRPVHEGLATLLAQVQTPQLGAELVAALDADLAAALAERVAEPARAQVRTLLVTPVLLAQAQAAQAVAGELDSFDARPARFRDSALARTLLPRLREARLWLIDSLGRAARARLASARGELRELLGQSLRLDYEIAGREREREEQGSAAKPLAQRSRARPQVGEDEELWPFQGEYWRDELGSYQFTLGERCQHARPGSPPPPLAVPAPGGGSADAHASGDGD